jgi:hypothetical protein
MRRLLSRRRLACALALAAVPLAWAQGLPPHEPGTICVTPQLWCRVGYRGSIGAECSCPTPRGWVRGRLA